MSVRAKTVMMPPSTVYLHVGFSVSNSILDSFLVFNICHDFKLFFPWGVFFIFLRFQQYGGESDMYM